MDALRTPFVELMACHPKNLTPFARMTSRLRCGLAVLSAGAALALAGVGAAQAADPTVLTTVTALPGTVTLARPSAAPPLQTYAAYEISVTNTGTNTRNHVRVLGSTVVTPAALPQPVAVFTTSIGLACVTTNAAQTAIECAIGQMASGTSASFIVVFRAPSQGAQIVFTEQTYYAEGANDSGNAAHADGSGALTATVTTLGTPTTEQVRSYIPPGGGTLFTGFTGIATLADKWTTTVIVPSAAKAEVVEALSLESCSADLLACYRSTLTIPGTFAQLVIELRRDASSIRPGAKIANAEVKYSHSGGPPIPLLACNATFPAGPSAGTPCIASRIEYKRADAPTPEEIGDWLFRIYALDNGTFEW